MSGPINPTAFDHWALPIDLPRDEAEDGETALQTNPSAIVAVSGIELSFGGVKALSSVDLSVAPGSIHAIIGPNGAGKSSLLNVIGGLYQPDKGTVQIAGKVFRKVPTQRLARLGIARTFQNLALFKGLTVLDNVVTGRVASARATFIENIIGFGRARREEAEARAAAEDIIAFLDLSAVKHRVAGTLPYGIQKRVELARALVAKPGLVLLDEPMAGMTATEKQEMAEFVRATRDSFGTTIILIEHDIGVVMGLSDRVAVLDYGRKIADGTPDSVQKDRAVIDAYLGVAHEDPTVKEAA
jgi:branched-chain amino acid transport system ATP-binding protein